MSGRLFIHHPVFRLISPLFVGSMVYVLILLINNDVGQLNEAFLGQELYVCVGLAYVIQELSRLQLVLFARFRWEINTSLRVLIQAITAILITVLLVTAFLTYYFNTYVGFPPSSSQLLQFNVIFSMVSAIYISLYLSHQLLHQINTAKISIEMEKKQAIQSDYEHYIRGINPQLLFQGLEALLVHMRLVHSPDQTHDPDELIDVLSVVYRYMLGNRSRELVGIQEEVDAMRHMAYLFDFLPYRKVSFTANVAETGLVLPGSVLQLMQELVSITIPSDRLAMDLKLEENEQYYLLSAPADDKVGVRFSDDLIAQLNQSLSHYSSQKITSQKEAKRRILCVPKLKMADAATG